MSNTDCTGLLNHLLHCTSCNTLMFHTYTLKKGNQKYRYYICSNAQKRDYDACPTKSINAQAIEDASLEALRKIYSNTSESCVNTNEVSALNPDVWNTLFPQEKRRILKLLIKQVTSNSDRTAIRLTLNENSKTHQFEVDLKKVRTMNFWHKEKEITKEPQVRQSLLLALQMQALLDQGKAKTLRDVAGWLKMSPARISQILLLNFLSPAIKEHLILGENSRVACLSENSLRTIATELNWQKQQQLWQQTTSN